MSECEQAYRLGSYLDGECSASTRAAIEQHLASCEACRGELERMDRLRGLLRQTPADEISPQAMARLHDAVDAAMLTGVRRLAGWAAAAAAIVLAACTLGLLRHSPRPPANGGPAVAVRQRSEPRPPVGVAAWESAAVARTPAEATAALDEQLAIWVVRELGGKDNQ